jgi:hypothetical protein
MATEILVNDGGAPCRIIPVIAAATILAGHALAYFDVTGADAKVKALNSGSAGIKDFAGVALTDAATGEMVNMVTGSGSIVRILCDNQDGGVPLMPSAVGGQLTIFAASGTHHASHQTVVAITAENAGAGLVKCRLC